MNEEKVDKYFEKNINELKKIASMCFTGDELEELLTIKTLEDCSFLDCTFENCYGSQPANNLLDEIVSNEPRSQLLYEFACIIGRGVTCNQVYMYLPSSEKRVELYNPEKAEISETEKSTSSASSYPMSSMLHLAEHVASSHQADLAHNFVQEKELVSVQNGNQSVKSREPSVICVPLTTTNNSLLCVIQLVRNWYTTKFTEDHLQAVLGLAILLTTAVEQSEVIELLCKQKQLNDFLLDFLQLVFSQLKSIDQVVEKIMSATKELVRADRCAMFLVDEKTNELYSCLLDEGKTDANGNPIFVKADIRFSIEKGIAGAVARSGEIINIADAYSDSQFNKEIDSYTGYTTKSILCMPILKDGQAIGVVEMINKIDNPGHFTKWDVEAFRLLAIYCNLALQFSKLYKHLEVETAQQKVAVEQLSFHYCASDCEVAKLSEKTTGSEDELPVDISSFHVPTLCRFIMTVKKNYREVPYHNFQHAWNVFHCIYCCLWDMKNINIFNPNQMRTLLIAAICHDIDHRGFNNAFFKKFDEPLAKLYKTSVMERHHYEITVKILQENGHNVLNDLSRTEYKQMLELMRHAVIATDLFVYATNIKRLSGNVTNQTFRLSNYDHFLDAVAIMMTGADISAICKPWNMVTTIVTAMYDEFYHQGDVELQLNEIPDSMHDRRHVMKVPEDQIAFIKNIGLPCYSTLAKVFPTTQPLLLGCRMTMERWEMIISDPNRELWKPDSILTSSSKGKICYFPRRITRTSKVFF